MSVENGLPDLIRLAEEIRRGERERIVRAIEALPVRHCHEDPTGVVLVNVSRAAALDAVLSPDGGRGEEA